MHLHHRSTHSSFGRRAFVGSLLAPAAALLIGARPRPHRAAAGRVGVLLAEDAADEMLERGTRLGMEEAQHTAELLQRPLRFVSLEASPWGTDSRAAAGMLRAADVRVVIAAVPTAALMTLGAAAAHAGAIILNVAARADELRERACDTPVFHVAASERMRRAALAAWRSGSATGDAADAVEWHPALTRFGAEQLNDRCRERFGARMNDAAWLGWVGAKIAAEALFRAGDAPLTEHLLGARAHFDGHKGVPLRFRARDRQLVQPLYIVSGSGVVAAEVPDTRRATPADFASFGVPDGAACTPAAPSSQPEPAR